MSQRHYREAPQLLIPRRDAATFDELVEAHGANCECQDCLDALFFSGAPLGGVTVTIRAEHAPNCACPECLPDEACCPSCLQHGVRQPGYPWQGGLCDGCAAELAALGLAA